MPRKNEQNLAGRRLRRLIAEALEEREKYQKALPVSVAPSAWPAWPYVDGANILGSAVSREIGPPEKSQEELERRLRQILYPYPEGNKSGKTFYQYVQSLGLLDLLMKPPLLWEIRSVWWFQRYHFEEADLRRGRKSQYGVALQFHRKVMFECSAHLHRLEQLAQKHNVSEKWLEDYRKAILEALLREAAVCYPKLRDPVEGRKPALQIRPHSFAVDGQVQLYEAIATTFAKRKKNNKLAYQLTALLCSSTEHVRAGKLEPTPENVRDNVRDRKNRKKRLFRKRMGKP